MIHSTAFSLSESLGSYYYTHLVEEMKKLEGGRKDDTTKSPVYQGCLSYFPRALKAVADISKYGLEKYGSEYSELNWREVKGGKERYSDALGRHLTDLNIDGPYAPDSKKLHLAHVAWNALAVLELALIEIEKTK